MESSITWLVIVGSIRMDRNRLVRIAVAAKQRFQTRRPGARRSCSRSFLFVWHFVVLDLPIILSWSTLLLRIHAENNCEENDVEGLSGDDYSFSLWREVPLQLELLQPVRTYGHQSDRQVRPLQRRRVVSIFLCFSKHTERLRTFYMQVCAVMHRGDGYEPTPVINLTNLHGGVN